MKLNKATLAAIKNTPAKAIKARKQVVAAPAKSKGKKAKAKTASTTDIPDGKPTSSAVMVALLSGERGFAARLVESRVYGKETFIRATHGNNGLPMKDATFAKLDSGVVTGNKVAKLELGCYVNGKSSGAKAKLLTEKQFNALARPCIVHWNSDDNGIHGKYIGNPNVKGMVAVSVQYGKMTYFWQMEMDSNANNKHERGKIAAIKSGEKLAVVTA